MPKQFFKFWWHLMLISAQTAFSSRLGAFIFVIAKFLRFAFFLIFLLVLQNKTNAIAGYTLWEVIIFFLTFNLIDVGTQFFLREVYHFREYVVSGEFDFILLKPYPPLLRSLFGGSDVLDIPMLILLLVFLSYAFTQVGSISPLGILFYIILVLNGFLIAFAFHIFVLSVGIRTTEVDNTIMLYRDVTNMGRVPIDVYREPVRSIMTFAIPVGIMMSFPAKALLSLLSLPLVLLACGIGLSCLLASLYFWRQSIRFYSSASS